MGKLVKMQLIDFFDQLFAPQLLWSILISFDFEFILGFIPIEAGTLLSHSNFGIRARWLLQLPNPRRLPSMFP